MFSKLLLEIALVVLRGLVVLSVAVVPTLAAEPATVQPAAVQAPVVEQVAAPEAIAQPVMAAAVSAPQLIRVLDPGVITVEPDTLPAALLNDPYVVKLSINGGKAPYELTLFAGTLPAGLELKLVDAVEPEVDYWAIIGTPTAVTPAAGVEVTIRVVDDDDKYADKVYKVLVVDDDAAPVITYTIDGVLGNNGWFVSDVTVDWTVVDDQLVDLTNCADVTITVDQLDTTYTCTVAGAAPVTTPPIKRDATRPVINNLAVRAYDANDWYNHEVTFTPECNDPMDPDAAATVTPSGILPGSCDALTYSGPDVKAKLLSFVTEDLAGNKSTPYTFTLNYDATKPYDVAGALERLPDHNGWYNAPVMVIFTGKDDTSGIDFCTEVEYDGPDSATASVMGSCTDMAGNTSDEVASASFMYDNTDPTASVVVNGDEPILLHHPDMTATLTANDNLSGVDWTVSGCGAIDTSTVGYKEVTCQVWDIAGNGPVVAMDGYNVIYDFEGFFRPVSEGWNEENAGRTLPIKFHLADYFGVDQDGAMVLFGVWEADCGSGAFVTPLPEGANIYPDLQPQQHGRYHYNWDTTKDMEGMCRVVVIDLGEGAGFEHTFLVRFK